MKLKELLKLEEIKNPLSSHFNEDLENFSIAFANFKDRDMIVWNNLVSANQYKEFQRFYLKDLRFELQDNNFLNNYKKYDLILIKSNDGVYYVKINDINVSVWNSCNYENGIVILQVDWNWSMYTLESQTVKDRLFFDDNRINLKLKEYSPNNFVKLSEHLENLKSQ